MPVVAGEVFANHHRLAEPVGHMFQSDRVMGARTPDHAVAGRAAVVANRRSRAHAARESLPPPAPGGTAPNRLPDP